MYYSSIGILALLIHFIINFDIFKKASPEENTVTRKKYRNFLLGVAGFYLVDITWGIFDSLKIRLLTYTETEVFFTVQAFSVFLWTKYVIAYLNKKNRFAKLLNYAGWFFLVFQIVVLIINCFYPIAFWVEENGDYHTGYARYANMLLQFILFFISSAHMMLIAVRTTGKTQRRHIAIGIFGFIMLLFIALQAAFPLMPFYSIGYMLGTAILHTFVLEDEKYDRHEKIEMLKEIEQIQEAELGSARQMAYTDPLTGVKNKNAYQEDVEGIERRIKNGHQIEFGIIVFDLNGLKNINDTEGHDAGDRHIKAASKIICHSFKCSPVYRIGGDEFAVFLLGEEFKKRHSLIEYFNQRIEKNLADGEVVISCGLSDYDPEHDKTYKDVFNRADSRMYERKRILKGL